MVEEYTVKALNQNNTIHWIVGTWWTSMKQTLAFTSHNTQHIHILRRLTTEDRKKKNTHAICLMFVKEKKWNGKKELAKSVVNIK